MNKFKIDGKSLYYPNFPGLNDFKYDISSIPRNYSISGFIDLEDLHASLNKSLNDLGCLLIDKNVYELYFSGNISSDSSKVYLVDATEEVKNIDTVLKISRFFAENNINKASNIFVIGGGVMQDLGGTSSYLYKRGVPWTYIPTTLLGISDSCLGGKTAVNFDSYKNLLGLFSAPKEVMISSDFIKSLKEEDLFCGYGEIYRLAITGGVKSFENFQSNIKKALEGNLDALKALIIYSLLVKKAVIEEDEFELNIRKSMNFGHTIGHALEAISNFRIPHGVGVCMGILVEGNLALNLKLMPESLFKKFLEAAKLILHNKYIELLSDISFEQIDDHLRKDKKTLGNKFNFSYISELGDMHFAFKDIDATKELIILSKNQILNYL